MNGTLWQLLQQYTNIARQVYGNILNKIVLFSSYARGDFDEESDIDVIILLDVVAEDERKGIVKLLDATYDFNQEHNVDIKPLTKSVFTFNKWKNILPFYKNISREGVVLYGV